MTLRRSGRAFAGSRRNSTSGDSMQFIQKIRKAGTRLRRAAFLAPFDAWLRELGDIQLLAVASALVPKTELRLAPGWYFGAAEENPADRAVLVRMAVWRACCLRRVEIPFLIEWHDGLRYHLYLGNDTSRMIFVDGNFDPNELVFLDSALKPGMVFVDVGANDGLYSLFASRRVGRRGSVLAFEPSRREFRRLKENIRINRLANVRGFPVALYNSSGKKNLRIADGEHAGQNTLGSFLFASVSTCRIEKVVIRTLDDIAAEETPPRIDWIKIDAEGAECAILEGAANVLRTYRPNLMMEAMDGALREQGRSIGDLLAILDRMAYDIFSFDKSTGKLIPARDGEPLSLNIVARPRIKHRR
jgi:FkbM family methyltransferase